MGFHVFESTVPPPPRHDNKIRRGYYTRSVLCDAVKQVMLGTMTVTQASRHYKIPRTTIQKHFSKAREQHNLKEMYIRRMEATAKGLVGQVSESDLQRQLSEHGTACLLSYGVEVWPSGSNETLTPVHWRQQPVRIDSSQSKYCNYGNGAYPFENEMVIAEHCEVTSNDVGLFESTTLRHESNGADSDVTDPPCKAPVKPLTRIVLRREGSDDVVKEIIIPQLSSDR